jgi:ribosome-binding protein aMBF1 (putative translation factor)
MIVCGFNTSEENHMAEIRRTDAVRILHHRYIQADPARLAEVDRERTNAEVAQLIYDRRVAAGLTQKEFAKLVGTTQSVISRLEDADYEGHSLAMLHRIANALGQRLMIDMAPREPERRRA